MENEQNQWQPWLPVHEAEEMERERILVVGHFHTLVRLYVGEHNLRLDEPRRFFLDVRAGTIGNKPTVQIETTTWVARELALETRLKPYQGWQFLVISSDQPSASLVFRMALARRDAWYTGKKDES